MSLDAEKKQTLLKMISSRTVKDYGKKGLQALVLEELSARGFDHKNDHVWQMHNGRLEPLPDEKNLADLLLEGKVLVFSDKEGDMRCMTADSCNGRFYLQSMTSVEAEQLRVKQDELAKDWNLKEPTILDKIVDFFARIFGSRDKVCEAWDAVYTTKLKESTEYADQYQTQKEQEAQKKRQEMLARGQKRAKEIEQNLRKISFQKDMDKLERGIQENEQQLSNSMSTDNIVLNEEEHKFRYVDGEEPAFSGNEKLLGEEQKKVFRLLPVFYKAEKNGFDKKIGEQAVNGYLFGGGYDGVWKKIIEGDLNIEEYDIAVKGMEHTLLSLDPSSPKAHMLGELLEVASGSECRKYIMGSDFVRGRYDIPAPADYKLDKDVKFIRMLQNQVRAVSDEMRILADKDNYKRYPEEVKKSLVEVSKAMLAEKLLEGIGKMELSQRKDLVGTFGMKYKLGLEAMERHINAGDFHKNIESVIEGLNGKILDTIETKTKEAESKPIELDTISRESIPVKAKDDVILPSV